MVSKNEVMLKFEDAIDEIDMCDIFKNELQHLAKSLQAYKDSLSLFNIDDQDKELEGKLDKIDELLEGLLEKIKLLSNSQFWSFLQRDEPIESIFTGITKIMNEIYELLQGMGIKGLDMFQPEQFFQDYTEVYDLIDNFIDMFQKRKREVEVNVNYCANKHRLSLRNESAREILKRYEKYKKSPDDYIIKRHFFSEGPFKYYEGTVKNNNEEKVILMKLSDNSYLGRILDVLSQMENESVEKLIGFYDKNSEDKEKEPKVTIITKIVGEDLFTFLHTNGKKNVFHPGDRTILIFKIAKAMNYIHSRNVIHRNLVPRSVFINKKDENDDIDVMIAGFRSSRLMPDTAGSNMTNRNQIFDYPTNFFAPEFDNNSKYNEKIDVFSFSGIVYELAKGKMPYSDKSEKETKCLLDAGERPEIEGISPDLANLIKKCWAQDPNDRCSFNDIVNEMAQKNIIFDQDKKKEEHIKDFYKKNTSNREKIIIAADLIESIKNSISNSYQYRHELFRTRSTLNYYQCYLNHDYNAEDDSDEEKEKIEKIIFILQQFSSVISKTLCDNWNSMAPTLEVSEIPEKINKLMLEMNESMRELGYIGEPYQESIDDLISDYRELYNTFETDKTIDKNVSVDKRNEIKKYLKEKDTNYLKQIKNPSNIATHDKIVNMLSNFSNYENNCHDFSQTYEVKRGKNSIIYEGYTKNSIPVAIKVFKGNDLGKSKKNLDNLRREIDYASKVNFKYIAKFIGYAINEKNNDVWLITELAKNAKINYTLKNANSKLSPEQKTKIAFRLAETMNYLNSQNISYGALTSSNVIIEGDNPKLVDFGNATPNIKDVEIETPDNPTQDEVKYDTRNDIFAFSMLLYEMLNGESEQGIDTTINEDDDTDLIKLIKCGLQDGNPENLTFEKIINRMINNQISFPDAEKEEIDKFYKEQRKS